MGVYLKDNKLRTSVQYAQELPLYLLLNARATEEIFHVDDYL